MTQSLICHIPICSHSYEIEINYGCIERQEKFLNTLASKIAIITDDIIAPLYGEQLLNSLSSKGLDAFLFIFPHGEQHKTRATKEQLENQLFSKDLGRDTCLIALGGGVVTDIAGYIAATYCRGIPFISMPTSLLGMADASVGGKTGVNTPFGKNLLGCIYQPKKIVIDPLTLQTLPQKELANGVVEMIKHGISEDLSFFEYLESHFLQLLSLNKNVLIKSIYESCRIKKNVIEIDERETGKRRLLNFGHTIGHALEHLTNYALSHGEAVAIGMLVECHLSMQFGLLSQASVDRIKKILLSYNLPLTLPMHISTQDILKTMILDKKTLNRLPRFVLIEKIGSACIFEGEYCTQVEESLIIKALDWMIHDLCRH